MESRRELEARRRPYALICQPPRWRASMRIYDEARGLH